MAGLGLLGRGGEQAAGCGMRDAEGEAAPGEAGRSILRTDGWPWTMRAERERGGLRKQCVSRALPKGLGDCVMVRTLILFACLQ